MPTSIFNIRFAIPTIFDSSAASGSPAGPKPAGSPAAGAGVGAVTPAQVTGAPIMTSLLSGKDVQPKSPGNHEDEEDDGESNNMFYDIFYQGVEGGSLTQCLI